jgi:hypothetical protein
MRRTMAGRTSSSDARARTSTGGTAAAGAWTPPLSENGDASWAGWRVVGSSGSPRRPRFASPAGSAPPRRALAAWAARRASIAGGEGESESNGNSPNVAAPANASNWPAPFDVTGDGVPTSDPEGDPGGPSPAPPELREVCARTSQKSWGGARVGLSEGDWGRVPGGCSELAASVIMFPCRPERAKGCANPMQGGAGVPRVCSSANVPKRAWVVKATGSSREASDEGMDLGRGDWVS